MYRGFVLIVSGRVQGVGFRWYTKHVAEKLGINGTVKNLPDGNVEIRCICEVEILKRFIDMLKKGNTIFRHVDDVQVNETDPDVLNIKEGSGFKILL